MRDPIERWAKRRQRPQAAGLPRPPEQPAVGPGGSDYPHASCVRHGPYWAPWYWNYNGLRYFIFLPSDPPPPEAPAVLFLHGWLAYKPVMYQGWIAHMVKKGYIVVWAQYDGNMISCWSWAANAAAAWRDALARLADGGNGLPVRPQRDPEGNPRTAIVGHSVGAYLGAILAARAADPKGRLPRPAALVCIEPGRKGLIRGTELSRIDPGTKLLLVAADADFVARVDTAVSIWNAVQHLPDRSFLFVRSDEHGSPALIANHFFPNTDGWGDTAAIDARDYYVTFKLSVGALNCAFRGTDREYVFSQGGPQEVDMGCWSDGVPVTPLVSIRDPQAQRELLTQVRR